MLPKINGTFGIIDEPKIQFSKAGKAYATFRAVAKKRTRDQNGQWVDGQPLFIDVVCFGAHAENLIESATRGDTLQIDGTLEYSEWQDAEGNTKSKYSIIADNIAVSLRWATAKTHRVLEDSGRSGASIEDMKTMLGAEVISDTQPEEAPF